MKPFLRVCTSWNFCDRERNEDNARFRKSQVQGDASRNIIKRAFAFDEWDDEETSAGDSRSSRQQQGDAFDNMDDMEIELLRTIHRSDAFDESEAFDEWVNGQRSAEQYTPPPFVPIQNNQGDINQAPPTTSTNTCYSPFHTKFDLDARDTTQPVAPVTPSPPKPIRNRTIECPIPLYSHQSLQLPTNLFNPNNSSTTANNASRGYPTNTSMEDMLRNSFKPSFPIVCDSIPRNASAFFIPTNNNNQNDKEDEAPNWFDTYCSGTTLFEEDDYCFDTPTRISDDDSLLFLNCDVPRFIVCNHNKE
eukprot:CAMPEP_0116117186 /NCGR_PEP_ID=MMETSP0329-20121206/1434_1 /TAXON_ID=697910 /ORGANISM="Pseudo-nitzschia arenysensis, Strain B593" /LENGTH=304 /DNA_ID=CAMNT_0003610725 /DNA_START=375 /DNA_END=1289 /DNA_ORIENTATION=-